MIILYVCVSQFGKEQGRKVRTVLRMGLTNSSRIQLPTDTPPQLMPPTRLPARDSRRGLSRFEPITEMGFVPLPHCAMLALNESFRAAAALNTALLLAPVAAEMLPPRSLFAALCSADVK